MFNGYPMFITQFWDCRTSTHATSVNQTVCLFFPSSMFKTSFFRIASAEILQ